ncbi:MAG: hypothetical protein IKZ66_05715, partial [Schwartzia sp.]|nr:hypothetical protein [Schwartzia sp. (in: firmicutes)]
TQHDGKRPGKGVKGLVHWFPRLPLCGRFPVVRTPGTPSFFNMRLAFVVRRKPRLSAGFSVVFRKKWNDYRCSNF